MNYLRELQSALKEIMGDDVDEEMQEEIAKFVSKKVYESWQNGKEQGQSEAKLGRLSKGLEKAGKRYFGKRKSTD